MIKTAFISILVLAGALASAQDAQDESRDLALDLRQNWAEIEEIAGERDQTPAGEERDVLSARIARRARSVRSDLRALMKRIEEAAENGSDASADRAVVEEILVAASPLIRREVEHRRDVVEARQRDREARPSDEHLELERQLTRDNQELDAAMSTLLEILTWKEALSLDATDDETFLDPILEERSDDLMARTELALGRRDEAEERLAGATDEEKASIEPEVRGAREAVHGNVASLEAMVAMMDERGFDSTEHKELLIEASGNVTTDIFDVRVFTGLFEQTWEDVTAWVVANGPQLALNAFFLVVILAVFWTLARIVRKIAERAVARTGSKVPKLLRNMLVSMSGQLVMLVGIIVALSRVGIDIAPLLAGVGVAGFIVGFALQDTLSNFASGVMILIYHPFDVGDLVEAAGVAGEVNHMSLVSTTIRTLDNQILIVPNNKIWGDVIRNKTAVRTRRVDLSFGIGYDDDIAHAERVLHDIVDSHELVLDEPPPTVKLHELGDSSVNFVVRPWVKTEDYWDVHWDITRAVKERFDAEGISIPYPQRDVHVHRESTPTEPLEPNLRAVEHTEPREAVPASGISAEDD